MSTEKKNNQILESNINLYLGLTRAELKKRLSLGELDAQILKSQLNQYSESMKLDALCEKWIEEHAAEQVENDAPELHLVRQAQ